MSERPPLNQQPDAAEAWADGSPDNAADLQAYLDSRPYVDEAGRLYLDAAGVQQILPGGVPQYEQMTQEAREAELNDASLHLPHEGMTELQLAHERAKAIHEGADAASQAHIAKLLGWKEYAELVRQQQSNPNAQPDPTEFRRTLHKNVTRSLERLQERDGTSDPADTDPTDADTAELDTADTAALNDAPQSVAAWLGQHNRGRRHETSDLPGEKRSYAPNQRDEIYTTSVLEATGQKLVWHDHKQTRRLGRQVMITTASGRQLFVRGDDVYDMDASEAEGKPVFVEKWNVDATPPDIEIGQGWLGGSDPVARVEVLNGKYKAGEGRIDFDEFPVSRDLNEIEDAVGMLDVIGTGPTKFDKAADAVAKGARAAAKGGKAAAKAAGKGTKAAAKGAAKAAKRGKEAAKKGTLAALEVSDRAREWTVEQAAQVGGFAVALEAEAPGIIDKLGEADQWIDEAYDGQKKKSADKLARYVLLHMVAVHETKQAARKAWQNRDLARYPAPDGPPPWDRPYKDPYGNDIP